MKHEENRLIEALEILRDTNEDPWLRDDIAMSLGRVDDERVLATLCQVAHNSQDDETVLNSCGEAIGAIWVRKGSIDPEEYVRLCEAGQFGVQITLEWQKPEWLSLLKQASGE